MADLELKRTMISDLSLDDEETLSEYKTLMDGGSYTQAVATLDTNGVKNSGIRASMVNSLKKLILDVELYILNLTADEDTFYSLEEPTDEQMEGKLFWVQPIIE